MSAPKKTRPPHLPMPSFFPRLAAVVTEVTVVTVVTVVTLLPRLGWARSDTLPSRRVPLKLVAVWGPLDGSIRCLSTSPSGDLLAVGVALPKGTQPAKNTKGPRGQLVLFHVPTGVRLSVRPTATPPRSLSFVSNRELTVLGEKAVVTQYTLSNRFTLKKTRKQKLPSGSTVMQVHPRTGELVVGTKTGALEIYHGRSGVLKSRVKGHLLAVKSLLFYQKGSTLVSIDTSGRVIPWRWSRNGPPKKGQSVGTHVVTCVSRPEKPSNRLLLGHVDGSVSRLQVRPLKRIESRRRLFQRPVTSVFFWKRKGWGAASQGGGWLWWPSKGQQVPFPTRHRGGVVFAARPSKGLLFAGEADLLRVYSTKPRKKRTASPRQQSNSRKASAATPIRLLAAHPTAVSALAFGPMGRLLVTAGASGSVAVWNPKTGRMISRHNVWAATPGGGTPQFVALSSGSGARTGRPTTAVGKRWWVMVGTRGQVVLGPVTHKGGRPATGYLRPVRGAKKNATPTAMVQAGDELLLGFSDGGVERWSFSRRTLVRKKKLESKILRFTLTPGGTPVAHLKGGQSFTLTQPLPGGPALGYEKNRPYGRWIHKGAPRANSKGHHVATDPKRRWFSTKGPGGGVRLLEAPTAPGRGWMALQSNNKPNPLRKRPKDLRSKAKQPTLFLGGRLVVAAHKKRINTLAFHPHQNLLATGSADGTLAVVDTKTWKVRRLIDSESDNVTWLEWCGAGHRLIMGDSHGSLRMWDTRTWTPVWTNTLHRGGVWEVRCTSDGERITSCGEDGGLYVWDAATGHLVKTLRKPTPPLPDGRLDNRRALNSLVVHPTLPFVIAGGVEKTLTLWDLQKLRPVAKKKATAATILTLEIDRNKKLLLAGTTTGKVRLFKLPSLSSAGTFGAGTFVRNVTSVPGEPSALVVFRNANTSAVGLFLLKSGFLERRLPLRWPPSPEKKRGSRRGRKAPKSLDVIKVSPSGVYAAGGAANGTLWIWKVR